MINTNFDVLEIVQLSSSLVLEATKHVYLRITKQRHHQEHFYKSVDLIGSFKGYSFDQKATFQISTKQEFDKAKKESQDFWIHISCLDVNVIKVHHNLRDIKIEL
jgi:hypothetical protein